METFLIITVRIVKTVCVGKVTAVYFNGEARGNFFNGEIEGLGCDVQTKLDDESISLSARYILSGVDSAQKKCRIYIENNADSREEYTRPAIYTDSDELKKFELSPLRGKITPDGNSLKIQIFAD